MGKNCDKCPVKREAPAVCNKEQEWVDEIISDCPVKFINENPLLFHAVLYKESGVLPNSGGWAEQPAKLMKYIGYIVSEKNHG